MNIQSSFDNILKIIIVGDSGVGKSNFLFRFINDQFSKIYQTTVGIDCKSKVCILPKSKKKVKINLWDTAGQERYMSINKMYFQKIQGIILMYDITQRSSFERLPKWVQLINETTFNIPVILIGNKIDDEEENRIVSTEEGKDFANQNGYLFNEASALSGKNVNNSIYDLCESIILSLELSTFTVNASGTNLDYFSNNEKNFHQLRNEKCC